MLEIKDLVKKYQGQVAVDQVSISIPEGKIFGLLGPNGAGKSSLLRMVTGITLPDDGLVTFDGEDFDINKHMSQIGYMPEERGLYKKMKVREQLVYLAGLKEMPRKDIEAGIDYWFDKLGMRSWANKKVEDLSKGMSQKLQFVATILHKPKLLILDEPFSGLDPVNTKVIKDEIFNLAKEGITIIFSTHRMEQVEEVCEDIALMDQGRIILEGEVSKIKQDFKENKYALVSPNQIDTFPFVFEKKGENVYIIQLVEGQDSNEILKYCLSNGIVVQSFKEILPTLNQIFIGLVDQSANRSFQS